MVVRAGGRPGAVAVIVVMAAMGGQLRAPQGVRLWDVMKMRQEARDAAQESQDSLFKNNRNKLTFPSYFLLLYVNVRS